MFPLSVPMLLKLWTMIINSMIFFCCRLLFSECVLVVRIISVRAYSDSLLLYSNEKWFNVYTPFCWQIWTKVLKNLEFSAIFWIHHHALAMLTIKYYRSAATRNFHIQAILFFCVLFYLVLISLYIFFTNKFTCSFPHWLFDLILNQLLFIYSLMGFFSLRAFSFGSSAKNYI